MSATVWYGNLIWDCPLPDGCGTAPCAYCMEMMGEIDGTLRLTPIILDEKEIRRREYWPFLED